MFPDYAASYYSIGTQRIDNKKLVHAVACMDEEPVRYSNLTRAVGRRHFHFLLKLSIFEVRTWRMYKAVAGENLRLFG